MKFLFLNVTQSRVGFRPSNMAQSIPNQIFYEYTLILIIFSQPTKKGYHDKQEEIKIDNLDENEAILINITPNPNLTPNPNHTGEHVLLSFMCCFCL